MQRAARRGLPPGHARHSPCHALLLVVRLVLDSDLVGKVER